MSFKVGDKVMASWLAGKSLGVGVVERFCICDSVCTAMYVKFANQNFEQILYSNQLVYAFDPEPGVNCVF